MTLAKDIASHLLKIQAVYLKPEEPFTWASGIKSPIYTDNRVTLAYPETRTLIENGFVLEAVAAAKREGADVLGVVAIFSYQLPKADKNFSDAGVKLVTLSNYSELIHLAQEEGYITPEGLDLLKRFKEDQENWQEV